MDLKKYQPTLVPGIIILGATLFLILFLPSQIRGISKEIKRIEKEEKETQEMKSKYLLVSGLDKEVLSQQALSVVSALPGDKNVPYVLQALRRSIADAGFVIQELKFSPGEIKKEESEINSDQEKLAERLPLSVDLVGPFDNLPSLFKNLEETLPLFQVLSMEASDSEKSKFSGRAEIRLATFYSPLKRFKSESISLDDLILSEEEVILLSQLSEYSKTVIQRGEKGPTRDSNQDPFKP